MAIWEILKSVILGIVQGISEWLPISSTGHMILVDEIIQLNMSEDFMNMYFVVIQFASVLAVVLIYFNKLNPFAPSKSSQEKKDTWTIWFKVLVGIIPVGIVGLLFEDIIQSRFYNWQTISITLIVYGVAFIIIERRNRQNPNPPKASNFNELTYKDAFTIGLFQVLSLIPGTSRSGSTIMGGLLVGISRPLAAEFSFFMSIPVMFGATLLKLGSFGWSFTGLELAVLLVGMAVSFIVSYWAIKFLMNYIQTNDFTVFGWYRIILGIIVIITFSLFFD